MLQQSVDRPTDKMRMNRVCQTLQQLLKELDNPRFLYFLLAEIARQTVLAAQRGASPAARIEFAPMSNQAAEALATATLDFINVYLNSYLVLKDLALTISFSPDVE